MQFNQLFLQRYDALYNYYLAGIWDMVSADLMRQRPHPRVNSIAWTIWHITRVEDACLNRFIMDIPQVLDDGNWMERMNIPFRHNGTDMTFLEVDDFSQRIDLPALRDYSQNVQFRTRDILQNIDKVNLDDTVLEPFVRQVIVTEGLAYSDPEGFIKNYTGLSKGRFLMTHGLTHSFEHLGEIETIASLLGIVFE